MPLSTYLLLTHKCVLAKFPCVPLPWGGKTACSRLLMWDLVSPRCLLSYCDFDALLLVGILMTEHLSAFSCSEFSNPTPGVRFSSISVSLFSPLPSWHPGVAPLDKTLRGSFAKCFILKETQAKKVLLSQQMLVYWSPKPVLFSLLFAAS